MNLAEIEKIVFLLLKEVAPGCDPEQLKPDDEIRKTLDIDSFDYLQFIVALSKSIGKDIPEEHYGKISSLNKLREYLSGENHMIT